MAQPFDRGATGFRATAIQVCVTQLAWAAPSRCGSVLNVTSA
jgi:hypothetical protein